ncbi:enolase-phosphatase E1 isoform X1 [Anastrepha ludens]|uniref:enolase-phosphatase E1 isoform X1 n=1 Tax=Anastrepha ludens TaxID=28586 RepID=UPI0023AF97C0|nr:enolase-phosphatase E1 isoform X1 [Anastrepha ludens]
MVNTKGGKLNNMQIRSIKIILRPEHGTKQGSRGQRYERNNLNSIYIRQDVLFPYAKIHTKAFLEETWSDADTQRIVQDLRNSPQCREYFGDATELSTASAGNIASFVNFLIDKDLKLGPLKTLQGLVWTKGYASSKIKGHIYADVAAAFKQWHEAGIRIAIYSSGSVKAQQLLFGQTELGNMLTYISGHYDTAVGNKQEKKSYANIAKDLALSCPDILFLTDVVKEAEAARDAGMHVAILNRPGNAPLTDDDKIAFTIVDSFDDLKIHLK